MIDLSFYAHRILTCIGAVSLHIVSAAVAAVVLCAIYIILSNYFGLPSWRSILIIRALTASTRDMALSDRITLPIAHLLEPYIHLNSYTKKGLQSDLRAAGMAEISPERYTAMSISFGILVMLPGLLFVFVGIVAHTTLLLIAATGLITCSVVVGIAKQRNVRKIAKRRRGRIELEIPQMTDSVLHSLSKGSGNADVKEVLRDYQRIAGADMSKEISYMLAEMEMATIGGIESAFLNTETRLNSANATSLIKGLIGIYHGEDMRAYLEGLVIEMNERQIEFATRAAKRRPNELTVPIWFVMGAMVVMIMILIGSTVLTHLPVGF
ncbi:hypothetical protein [Ethanoligenens sp.]|uniref:hypothetical protein n=1 Tax=Ethanoligenens sp. TaxID=2099655 RepID=UPI0039E9E385